MSEILLSICISSYNRADRCCRLVESILSVEDDRYNIFICDDASDEDTVNKLKLLHSSKVKLIENKRNVGSCKNWFRTIDCGDGKYILHVLDRDDIKVSRLKTILDILEKHPVGAGYISKSAMRIDDIIKVTNNFVILEKGRDAFLVMAGVPIHPTGFLISKEQWKKENYRKFFYNDDKYGIYPHSYVLGRVSLQSNMLYIPILFYTYKYTGTNKQSRFYSKTNNKNYWWYPDNMMKTANQMILYLYRFAEDAYKEEFICRRFKEGLHRATIGYRTVVADKSEMSHYGMCARNVSDWELVLTSLKYLLIFIYILNKTDTGSAHMGKKIVEIFITNLKYIYLII